MFLLQCGYKKKKKDLYFREMAVRDRQNDNMEITPTTTTRNNTILLLSHHVIIPKPLLQLAVTEAGS